MQTTSSTSSDQILGSNSTTNATISAESRKIGEALKQVKQATSSVCDAVGSLGSASTGIARQKVEEGKQQLTELSAQTEAYLKQRPLMAIGLAFAAGIIAAKLISPRD